MSAGRTRWAGQRAISPAAAGDVTHRTRASGGDERTLRLATARFDRRERDLREYSPGGR